MTRWYVTYDPQQIVNTENDDIYTFYVIDRDDDEWTMRRTIRLIEGGERAGEVITLTVEEDGWTT